MIITLMSGTANSEFELGIIVWTNNSNQNQI